MEQLELPFKLDETNEKVDWSWVLECALMQQSIYEQQLHRELEAMCRR